MSFDFANLKKPAEYGDGKGTVLNRPLSPAEMHQNLITLGDAIAALENGGGSGDGLFNYVTNGKFEADASGWTNGTGFTVARTTVGSEILSGSGTGKITKDAANRASSYISTPFTLENRHLGKTLQIEFDGSALTGYTTSGLFEVVIWDVTAGTELPLSESAIPAGSGKFLSKFNASGNASYQLRIRVAASNTSTTVQEYLIDNIRVGEEVSLIGGAIGPTTTYALTIGGTTTAPTKGTVVEDIASWARHGDKMVWNYRFKQSTGGTAGSGTYLFPLPSGMSIDLTKHPAGTVVGSGKVSQNVNELSSTSHVEVVVYDANNLKLHRMDTDFNTQNEVGSGSLSLASITVYGLTAMFSISGWSTNVNLMSDFTEYASNSSATDADDTASFVYGPSGSVGIIGVTNITAIRNKRVRFTRPIQSTDLIILEIYDPTSGTWVSNAVNVLGTTATFIVPGFAYRSAAGGFTFKQVNSTDLDVVFQTTSDGASGNTWNLAALSGYKWRVRKVSNGNMAEVPTPRVFSARMGTLTNIVGPAAVKFGEILAQNGIDYESATGKILIRTSGYYRISFVGFTLNAGGPHRVAIGHNNLTPSQSNCVGNAYAADTTYEHLPIEAIKYLTEGDFLSVYLISGTLYNQSTDLFNYISIQRL